MFNNYLYKHADETIDLCDNNDEDLALTHNNVKRFKMSTSNDLDIVITNNNPEIFRNCSTFPPSLAQSGEFWHMIVVHHGQKVSKSQILDKLFEIVSDSEFFPVSYTQTAMDDFFLIRLCRLAIDKIFQNNLRLNFGDQIIYLTIKFQVAQFKLGQIYPSKKYTKACNERLNQLITCEGIPKVLNMDDFSSSAELDKIIANLSNKQSLQLLLTTLDNICEKNRSFAEINGIRLSNNGIKSLQPFTKLSPISLEMIDLRNNNISSLRELSYLKKISFKQLYLEGNPIVKQRDFIDSIKEMFPDLLKIDKTTLPSVWLQPPNVCPIEINKSVDVYRMNDVDHNVKVFSKYKTLNMWHQVIIYHDGKYSQEELLSALFDMISPSDLYPCYYKTEATQDSFFVRDSYDQLELLYEKKLQLVMSDGSSIPLILKMRAANIRPDHLNPTESIQVQITKSFNLMNKILNLEKFAESECMQNIVCRLSVPRTLTNVLSQASRKFLTNVELLKLNFNDLKSARGMHPIIWMKGLKEIDLSNNKIESLKDLESIPKATITEIWLQGNPLCFNYASPAAYIAAVKEILPKLEKLDGKDLNQVTSLTIQQNFLCSLEAYDLVEQFIAHYFTCFDSLNRYNTVKGMYHQKSILTMSTNSFGMADNTAKSMALYIDKSRNFKRVVNQNPMFNLFEGPDQIGNLFNKFGKTEHDFKTFAIDVTSYTPTRAVITVNGIFREVARSLNDEDLTIAFSRTFIICRNTIQLGMFQSSEEFKIVNDMILFYRPTIKQIRNSFVGPMMIRNPLCESTEITDEDKQGLVIIFHELTGLSTVWCKKFLQTTSWNFRQSLESFLELDNENKVPPDAYRFN